MTPPPIPCLASGFNAQDGERVVAAEAILRQEPVLQERRGETHDVAALAVPRVAIRGEGALAEEVGAVPDVLLRPGGREASVTEEKGEGSVMEEKEASDTEEKGEGSVTEERAMKMRQTR